jgi:hypothetical protein
LQSLARNGYPAEQVKKALHSSNRTLIFRYELLDNENNFKRHLDNILSGRIENNALAQIKRIARFSLRDNGTINFLSDRIKPYARLKMPDGGFTEWPLGVFILSTPPRKIEPTGGVRREVEAYDQMQVLVDDRVTDRYSVATGTNYIAAVKTLLDGAGVSLQNLTPTDKTLPAARDWEPGTQKIKIINNLLDPINYRALWFDEEGYAVAQPYISPAQKASEYTYRDDDESVIFPNVEQSLDLFGVPNKWVLFVSEVDRSFMSSYINDNQNSPTSTVNRGRTIVDYRQDDAVDLATLDAKVQRIAFESSQIYEQIQFETAIMPFHSHADDFTLEFSSLGISAKYSEKSWSFDLKAGSKMVHQIRRVVNV